MELQNYNCNYTSRIIQLCTALTSVLFTAIIVAAAEKMPDPETPVPPQSLKVMTFNLRFASPTPPNSWPERRSAVSECLRLSAPDLIGTQEGIYSQLQDIAADRPEYSWIGVGRDGGSRGEFTAVFYRKDRFQPLEFDFFWLSDTPEVAGSKTWGNIYARMVTWVKLRDLADGHEFYFFNTHLDHQVQAAREMGAKLMLDRVNALQTALPIIVVGDFNAAAQQNKAYDILTGENGLSDTWLTAARRVGPNVGTLHRYAEPITNGKRIDWILTRGAVAAEETEIVTYEQNGQRPSDHFPVTATLRKSTQ